MRINREELDEVLDALFTDLTDGRGLDMYQACASCVELAKQFGYEYDYDLGGAVYYKGRL